MKITAKSIQEMFSKEDFPQLYSKRGFEKSRVRFVIPPDRTKLAYVTDKNGKLLSFEL